ncbi:MAG: hypothetical protein O3A00_02470 [Planctomycetota bacterium]|nr:hypothetical protein [Planctomycetota bacterium]
MANITQLVDMQFGTRKGPTLKSRSPAQFLGGFRSDHGQGRVSAVLCTLVVFSAGFPLPTIVEML